MERWRWLLPSAAIVFVAVLGAMGSVHASAAESFEFGEIEAEMDWDEGETEASQDEGEAADECELADEAAEEACEEALEAEEIAATEAEECRLESAEATVAALPGRNQLRLIVRYRTFEPSAVAIDLDLRGAKGAIDFGSEGARFARSGTLRTTETLSEPQMERALAAREFTVGIYALNTPEFCRRSFERHLTARKGGDAGPRWSDPGAARRAAAAHASRAA